MVYLESANDSKEDIARAFLERDHISEGLVCVLTSVEACWSYDVRGNRARGRLEIVRRRRKCLHLYFYFVDREFGLMHVRLQTWFPFDLHVCLNGREWLARQMDREGLTYTRRDNCFTALSDPARAQVLADQQLDTRWARVFQRFAKQVHPLLGDLLREQSYYWTLQQGEYATDVMFSDAPALAAVYPQLVQHAILSFHSDDVLRFFGRKNPRCFKGQTTSDLKRRHEGVRIRHSVHENSIKMYDKQGSVLRIETTINNPRRFTAYRSTVRDGRRVRAWLPLRKGVADMRRRAEISRAANHRYLNALAAIPKAAPACRVLDPVSRPVVTPTQRFRPLRPITVAEAALFAGILRGEYVLSGFRNADVRAALFPVPTSDAKDRKRQAAKISRCFRLLRAHHLIRKLSGTSRYLVTKTGTEVMATALQLRDLNLTELKQTA